MPATAPARETSHLPDLDPFFRSFAQHAGAFTWFLVEHNSRRMIRTRVEGALACPVAVLGYARAGRDKGLPSTRDMASAAGISDRAAACLVHHADEIESSRYFRPDVRAHLLKLCSLSPET